MYTLVRVHITTNTHSHTYVIIKLIVPSCQSLGQWAVSYPTPLRAPRNPCNSADSAVDTIGLCTRSYVAFNEFFNVFFVVLPHCWVCANTHKWKNDHQTNYGRSVKKKAKIKLNNAHGCVIYRYETYVYMNVSAQVTFS